MNNYHERKTIKLVSKNNSDWRGHLAKALANSKGMYIEIDCHEWSLNCLDLKEIVRIANKGEHTIVSFRSKFPETVVSASALSLKADLTLMDDTHKEIESPISTYSNEKIKENLIFHKGTLRSGELLESDGDLMILGDVNPGAMVCAQGNIMVWGRLLGTAHAGKSGNIYSKISALQLRPLQLRIADKIARGPKEKPEGGIAEQAEIETGEIIIKTLKT
tara:strand:- start:3814 stop:4470 length:657 start_codon:yes stop_codon:yes gene_type:complete